MIIDGIEFPDDPENDGEIVRHISITRRTQVILGHLDGDNEMLFNEVDVYVCVEPGDALWNSVVHSFGRGLN